jgi:hypothetical protein
MNALGTADQIVVIVGAGLAEATAAPTPFGVLLLHFRAAARLTEQ